MLETNTEYRIHQIENELNEMKIILRRIADALEKLAEK